jgi:hypothetical protein
LPMKQFWNRLLSALVPNFETDEYGRALEATFRLLTHLMKVLVALTAIWAIAAGFLQTGRLIKYIPGGLPGQRGFGFWADRANWLGPWLGVPVYALKAFGVTMLIGLAAAMVGGLLGFLFGVPRVSSAPQLAALEIRGPGSPTSAGQAAGSPVPDSGAARLGRPPAVGAATFQGGRGWQSSTNLTEISDWLTKIIVGVGLVEAKAIYERLSQLSGSLGTMLFDGAVGTLLVIPAVIIAGALIGFLYAYLFTQLVVAGLVARTDAELSNAGVRSQGVPAPSGVALLRGAVLPPDIQARKEAFSNYIQGLVDANDNVRLDQIAQVLSAATDPDPRTERRNILTAVGTRVDAADAARAATQMTELSSQLRAITSRDF